MVLFLTQKFNYEHPWHQVTSAIFQKYPNPFASHVLTSDVIERRVDPETGVLHTTRLFLKKGTIPKWGRSILKNSEAYILEISEVDPRTQTMKTVTKNLSLTKLMLVEETQIITPLSTGGTEISQRARVVSNVGWSALRSRIENFGVKRFRDGAQKSARGLRHVLEKLTGHFHSSADPMDSNASLGTQSSL